jgi:hypothetical protein
MPREIDRPVAGDELVLLERVTPLTYREWIFSHMGGIESLPLGFRERLPAPEEELKTLLARMLPRDELWLARSRRFEPSALIGNKGIAIVRDGTAVFYRAGVFY